MINQSIQIVNYYFNFSKFLIYILTFAYIVFILRVASLLTTNRMGELNEEKGYCL